MKKPKTLKETSAASHAFALSILFVGGAIGMALCARYFDWKAEDAMKLYFALFGGVFTIFGGFAVWERLRLGNQQTAHATAQLEHMRADMAAREEKATADRFVRAMENLEKGITKIDRGAFVAALADIRSVLISTDQYCLELRHMLRSALFQQNDILKSPQIPLDPKSREEWRAAVTHISNTLDWRLFLAATWQWAWVIRRLAEDKDEVYAPVPVQDTEQAELDRWGWHLCHVASQVHKTVESEKPDSVTSEEIIARRWEPIGNDWLNGSD